MTNADVLIQALSEATGEPKEKYVRLFEHTRKTKETTYDLFKEISTEEAESLLNNLRQNKSGVMSWLVKSDISTILKQGNA